MRFDFGKYEGQLISDIIIKDFNYVKWCIDNIDDFDYKIEYEQYLNSNQWQINRQKILWRDKSKCRICGSSDLLQVHHLSYKKIGNEKKENLITLCKAHHEEETNIINRLLSSYEGRKFKTDHYYSLIKDVDNYFVMGKQRFNIFKLNLKDLFNPILEYISTNNIPIIKDNFIFFTNKYKLNNYNYNYEPHKNEYIYKNLRKILKDGIQKIEFDENLNEYEFLKRLLEYDLNSIFEHINKIITVRLKKDGSFIIG